MRHKLLLITLLYLLTLLPAGASPLADEITLDSEAVHDGSVRWIMRKASDVTASGSVVSQPEFDTVGWMDAVVPGTVLTSLVYNDVYPEPYYGLNNKIESELIPDIAETGPDFYTYWFRAAFDVPESFAGKTVWLKSDGINYRSEIWINGRLADTTKGMFMQRFIDITDYIRPGKPNVIAVKVYPVDAPGSKEPKSWGAPGEFRNGGNGEIGLNTTMLMSVGWDFSFMDGIRDRNTGIWRGMSLFTTGKIALRHPFVRSALNVPACDVADETVSVEVVNATSGYAPIKCTVRGDIVGENITFEKTLDVYRGEEKTVTFTPADFPQLRITNPRLWWPVNKGEQNLYELKLTVEVNGEVSDSLTTRFGIRDITSDRNTPDGSRVFYVNGKRLFIRGSNWIPEGMLRTSDERTRAELLYTRQSGINLLRMWGGGIAESDYFFELCDELGILVWQEFWLTGDTKHPADRSNYLDNVESTVKRIRNHPSLAYYVASNESSEVSGTPELLARLDGTRGYQMQSECDGVHDGSPYKQVNPMQHYENTASPRGSRVDGFNPEYGAPTLPTAEVLREMMPAEDIFPINKEVWDYLDGNGFHLMSTMYADMTDKYGTSQTIEEFARKAQLVGAINSKSIWEVWNYNKLDNGDRFCSGLLFWYHNCPVRQVAARMWDWSLEPTASLYHTANSLEPLHPQFDYLKNTVSVVNDYYHPVSDHKVVAKIYDLDSRLRYTHTARVDIEADSVANDVLHLDFPDNLSQVHFISLELFDSEGKRVGSNFYWRSNDEYEGPNTLTGPAVSGFESLAAMKRTRVKVTADITRDGDTVLVKMKMRNPSKRIAFFNRLEMLDSEGMSPVRPSFYSDNFFTLLPGESKTVTIETAVKNLPDGRLTLRTSGWNSDTHKFNLTIPAR